MELSDFAHRPDSEQDLLTGALLIARDAYPNLDFDAERKRLDELAQPLVALRLGGAPAREQADAVSEYVYQTLGFDGNEEDYYDPRNSYLNMVVERRLGIPITLAAVYSEIARRAGVVARGVGFPSHFLVRVEDGRKKSVLIDPFHSGMILDAAAIRDLWERIGGVPDELDQRWLLPMPVRGILTRMLANLRGVYQKRGDLPALLVVLSRILELVPDDATTLRERGLVARKLGAPAAAREDLVRYLALAPEDDDVGEVRRVVDELASAPAARN
jgi:regulator of sirC expression with transglutaminase-like and TPR domain